MLAASKIKRMVKSLRLLKIKRMVKSLRQLKIRQMVKSLRQLKIRRMVKSLRQEKIKRMVKSLRLEKIRRMVKSLRALKSPRLVKYPRLWKFWRDWKSKRPACCLGSDRISYCWLLPGPADEHVLLLVDVMNLACSLQVRGELQPPCFYGWTLSCTVPAACTGPPCQEMAQ